jgi:TrpR-related protein YerC/YecD
MPENKFEDKDLQDLFKTIVQLKTRDECQRFFIDLCTPAELAAMADRWKAARLLREGYSYREIYEKSGVSTATVTRVARCLTFGAGGYRLILDRLNSPREDLKELR